MPRKNANKKVTKASERTGQDKALSAFINDYSIYPNLTQKLDRSDLNFSQELINEIVLWKISRYVEIPLNVFESLNGLRNLRVGQHRNAEPVLISLLRCAGVRLPMASTILRFANPDVFQIYDRHICRAMWGTCEKLAPKNPSKAVQKYWSFLDDLLVQCGQLGIPFREADRILFEFDKAVNPPLSETEA